MRSTRRVISSAARREKGQEHYALRVDPVYDEVCHPVRQRIGLAGTRAGNDQERRRRGEVSVAEFDGAALLWIEMSEVGAGHRGGQAG
jgi:hypothetical protein